VCIDLHQTGSVGEDSDDLQLIKFWPSCAPGRGSVAGGNICYNQRAVFAYLRALFHFKTKIVEFLGNVGKSSHLIEITVEYY